MKKLFNHRKRPYEDKIDYDEWDWEPEEEQNEQSEEYYADGEAYEDGYYEGGEAYEDGYYADGEDSGDDYYEEVVKEEANNESNNEDVIEEELTLETRFKRLLIKCLEAGRTEEGSLQSAPPACDQPVG